MPNKIRGCKKGPFWFDAQMSIFEIISASLLAIILLWAAYHSYILIAGIRSKYKHNYSETAVLPKFSLIVPAKDEGTVLGRCLDALIALDYPRESLEIIVVEGNSKDITKEICSEFTQKYPSIIKIVQESTSRGKPAALNLAQTHVTGEITGVFDADSVPEKDTLRKIASYFNDNSVTAVQGRAVSLNETKNMLTRVAAKEEKAWFQALLGGREKLNLFVALTGSCQFVRTKVLEELGGWEENSLTEDVELALRLVEKNYLIKYAPDVCFWQETPNAMGDLIRQRGRWYRGYMEAALKYGRLLDKINKKTVDAEISLVGPFIMVLCLVSYFNWALTLLFSFDNGFPDFAFLVVALTAISLLSIGAGLVYAEKPAKLKNILWIPFVYVYWLVQTGIAGWAFLQILFRRRRVWNKTVKKGFTTQSFP